MRRGAGAAWGAAGSQKRAVSIYGPESPRQQSRGEHSTRRDAWHTATGTGWLEKAHGGITTSAGPYSRSNHNWGPAELMPARVGIGSDDEPRGKRWVWRRPGCTALEVDRGELVVGWGDWRVDRGELG